MKFLGKSPVRISLCNGGDTDYYIKEMGWTNLINATLSSGFYNCIVESKNQKFIDYSYKNNFSETGNFRRIFDLNDEEKDIKLITETIKEINPNFRGDIKVYTNVPEKSGLGGSTSLIVSLVKALIKTTKIENVTPEKIARIAYKIERINLGIKGGYQDQWAAAFSGGVNYLEFRKDKVFLEPLWLSEDLMKKLEDNLILFFIEPRKGNSGNVHEKLEARMKQKGKREDINTMLKRRENVLITREALLRGDFRKFSELLNIRFKAKLFPLPGSLK